MEWYGWITWERTLAEWYENLYICVYERERESVCAHPRASKEEDTVYTFIQGALIGYFAFISEYYLVIVNFYMVFNLHVHWKHLNCLSTN